MARSHGSSNEVALLSTLKHQKARLGGFGKASLAGLFSIGLVGVGAMPAYASDVFERPVTFSTAAPTTSFSQELVAATAVAPAALPTSVQVAEIPEPEPVEEERQDAALETQATGAHAEADAAPAQAPTSNIPSGALSSAMVRAMQNQIGVPQDCTDAVQNALAELGLTTRRDRGGYDYGPMKFGEFGVQIPPSEARPGDIMMRPGHVGVYTGDGVHHSGIHGGWPGPTTVVDTTNTWSSPYNYAVIIRLQ